MLQSFEGSQLASGHVLQPHDPIVTRKLALQSGRPQSTTAGSPPSKEKPGLAHITRQDVCVDEAPKWPPNIGISRPDNSTTSTKISGNISQRLILRQSEEESAAIGVEHLPSSEKPFHVVDQDWQNVCNLTDQRSHAFGISTMLQVLA